MKKHNYLKTILFVAFISVMIAIIGYGFAKYRESSDGNIQKEIAKWSFKVNDSESGAQTFNLINTINQNDSVAANMVAPGTSGYFDLKLDGRGSETAINYVINANFENKPENLNFYIDENYSTKLMDENGVIIINGFIPVSEVDNIKYVRIYWDWPLETGNTEEEIFENNLKDSEMMGKDMIVDVKVSGIQVQPEVKSANYTAHYYLENANDDNFVEYTTKTYTKNTDSDLTISDIAIDIPNAKYAYGSATPLGDHVANIKIADDGTTEVYLYYLRSRYELTVVAGQNIGEVKSVGLSTGTSNDQTIDDKKFEQSKTKMTIKYKYGETVTITATPENVAGYTGSFEKWSAKAKDSETSKSIDLGTKYVETNATTEITMPTEHIEITATGKKLSNNYSVKFDSNAGNGTMADQSFVYGTEQALTKNTFTKTGYTFANWNTESDGTGTKYSDGQVVKDLVESANGSITLYAEWKPIEYIVVFDANGGTGNVNDQTFKYDEVQTLQENKLEKPGYVFSGWNLAKDGSDTSYANKESILNLTSVNGKRITIYAQWSANSYTVVFNANGGKGTMLDQIFTYDVAKNLKPNTFTKKGYTFAGWMKSENGTEEIYTNNQEVKNITTSGTITLYAKWIRNKYTVVYNSNAPVETVQGNMENSNFEYDVKGVIKENAYLRKGYKFKCWNTASNGTGTTYSNSAEVNNLTDVANGIVTLYAEWTPNTYRINFNSNNGTGSMEAQTILYDVTANLNANAFKKTGYSFASWNTKSDGTGNSYNNNAEVKNLVETDNGSITLYAIWTPNTNTPYKVTHYIMSTSGVYVESLEENLVGTSDSKISISNLVKTTPAYNVKNGIYCKKAVINGRDEISLDKNRAENNEIETISDEEVTIKADGSLEIALCYARTYGYLTLAKGDNISKIDVENNIQINDKLYYYGQKLPEITATANIEQGYLINFEKWESNNTEYVKDITTNPIKDYLWGIMPEETEITLTAKATRVASDKTPYKVNYYLENAENQEYTLYSTKSYAGTTNSKITLDDVDIGIANCTIKSSDMTDETVITADGKTELNVYYNRNKYNINIVGAENISEVKAVIEGSELSTSDAQYVDKTITKQVKWGQAIQLKALLESQDGYNIVFSGWESESQNLETNFDSGNINTQITMPAESVNITATASKTANTYTIVFDENTGNGKMTSQTFTYDVKQKLSKNTFTKTGYTFKGWTTEIDKSEVVYVDEAEILNLTTKKDEVITLYAVWKDETAPVLTMTTTNTTKSITVNITTIETGSGLTGNYKYYIGTKNEKTGQIEYGTAIEKPDTTHTFEGLKDGSIYYIKVEIADKSGNVGKIEDKEENTKELQGEITFTDGYWSNGKYIVTVNTEAKNENKELYNMQYQVLKAKDIANGKTFNAEENWEDETITSGTVMGLGTEDDIVETETQSGSNDENISNNQDNQAETYSEETQNSKVTKLILKDGDIIYARVTDEVNGAKVYYNYEIKNPAKKTYTDTELAQLKYAVPTIDILAYEVGEDKIKVDVQREITGTETYDYYAKSSDESEYKLISTSTNWNDMANVSNKWLKALNKEELKPGITYKVKVLLRATDGTVTQCLNTATMITREKAEQNTSYAENRTYIDESNYTAVIPAGFKVSGTAGENKISSGMVLKDSDGNEFVWVPVNQAKYIKGATAIPTSTSSTTTYYKPMAKEQANGKGYEGLLYSFNGGLKSYIRSIDGIGTYYFKEPSLITGTADDGYTWDITIPKGTSSDANSKYYSDELGFSSAKELGNYMNKEYQNMINSTDEYGGYYIGRYETSLNGTSVESKANKTPMSEINWYKMYFNQDSVRNSNNTYYNSNSVTSSMVWGSQYRSMLNWISTGSEKSKLQATNIGNKSNVQAKTGSYSDDKMNNIYDLTANVTEFSQWGIRAYARALCGATFDKTQLRTATQNYDDITPGTAGPAIGSRLALYINNQSKTAIPQIKITEATATANTVTVKIQTTNQGTGISKYYYSISTDGGTTWETQESYAQEYIFTKLASNTTYMVKVQAEDRSGNKSPVQTKEITTEGTTLEEGGIYVKGKAGSSGTGKILLAVRDDYKSQGYSIQYQVKVANNDTVNAEKGRVTEIDEKATWISGELIKGLYENDVIYARLNDGTNYTSYMTVTVTDLETFSNIYSETGPYKDPTGKEATIPAGFKVGTSETINKIDDGLVIEDEKGNQYVWVPVESAIANGTTYPTSTSSTSTYKPMAIYQDNSTEYYQSLIYLYSKSAKSLSYVNTSYKIGNGNWREPSLVTGAADGYTWDLDSLTSISGKSMDALYYKSYLKFSSVTEYGKYKNEEYKNMIDSVQEYKGFYVGRYEVSIDSGTTKVAQSQSEKKVIDSSNSINCGYNAIYYQDSNRNSSNPYYNSKSVTSSMIWNAQYDAMLNWLLQKSDNKQNVFSTTLGNHKTATTSDESGTNLDDITNNIFDLGGNVQEITQASLGATSYARRGGSFYRNSYYPGTYNMSNYGGWKPNDYSSGFNTIGSRMTLYITKQSDTTKPTISVNGEPTVGTNNVYLKINAKDENSGIKKYHYYISTDGTNYTEYIGWGNSYRFEKLTPGTKYYVKAKVEDKAGNVSEETEVKQVITLSIDAIDDILTPRVYGSNGDGRVYFKMSSNYETQGYYVQYQVVKSGKTFNVNGTWTKDATNTAIGLSVGDTVYARVNDGTNVSNYRSVAITELETFETYSEYSSKNSTTATDIYYTYTDEEGKTAYIPKDFSVGVSSSINKISSGLVVQDKSGSQYVWVPVDKDKVVYDGSKLKTDGTDTYKPMVQYQSGYSESTKEQYFEGIRWNYSKSYATGSVIAKQTSGIASHILGTSDYREPSLVTGAANYSWVYQVGNNQYDSLSKYYKDICGFSSATEFGQYMNDQYTNMIKSVKEYGGFYIGRYETSLTTGTVESKINKTPMDSRTGTETSSNYGNLWYGMYNKQDSLKNTHNPYYNSTTVVSSMIWGSQYDAMLNWALTGNEANMVFERTGNHSGSRAKTGRWGSNIMNNIFDLSSNTVEWTQEAVHASDRAFRGGDYGATNTGVASSRNYNNPAGAVNYYGSRLTLYMRSSEP